VYKIASELEASLSVAFNVFPPSLPTVYLLVSVGVTSFSGVYPSLSPWVVVLRSCFRIVRGYLVYVCCASQVWGPLGRNLVNTYNISSLCRQVDLSLMGMEEVPLVEVSMIPRLVMGAKIIQYHHNLEPNSSPPIGSGHNYIVLQTCIDSFFYMTVRDVYIF
jgi:hypothetical protein